MPNALSREADTWCAWDDAEALEGGAGSGLERLVKSQLEQLPGPVGNRSSCVFIRRDIFPFFLHKYPMIPSSLEISLSERPFHDPALDVVSFWDIDIVRSVRTKGENIF